MLPKRLNLAILAQALEDALRAEFGKPLTGAPSSPEDIDYALMLIGRYPSLAKKFRAAPDYQKKRWLSALEATLEERK